MAKEAFLARPRYQAMRVRGDFSDEEMARDWTLSEEDKAEVSRYRKKARLFVAVQICAVRLWGRLLADTHDLSPRISGYLSQQLELEPSLRVEEPERKATLSEQRSYFNRLKAFPPEASIKALQHYLALYERVVATGIDRFEIQLLEPASLEFFFKQARTYHAKDLKRFNRQKRYGLMVCFLLETRKQLLDYPIKMHDQYLTEMTRECKNAHQKQLNRLLKRKKKSPRRGVTGERRARGLARGAGALQKRPLAQCW